MEFHTLYQWAYSIVGFFTESDKLMTTLGMTIGATFWIGLFFLQGAGLYVMAKRCGLQKRGLAFVPFANIYYMGKIVGECSFFGQRMKRAGLYAMIAQIVATLLTVAFVLSEWYLFFYHEHELVWVGESLFQIPSFPNLSGFAGVVADFYDTASLLVSCVGLVAEVFMLILMIGLYKKYSPANYRFLGILTFFFPVARFIAVFVFRNRQPVDYEAYMRRQHEEYIRRQQQYYNTYGNPYGGNPYGGYGGGYNGGYRQPPQAPSQQEPFEEFSSNAEGGAKNDEPFEEFSANGQDEAQNSDDFFN